MSRDRQMKRLELECDEDLAKKIQLLFRSRVEPHVRDWAHFMTTQPISRLAERCYTQGILDFIELCEKRPMDVVPLIGEREK